MYSTNQNYTLAICQICKFSSVQSLSRVRLFVFPWTAAHQASLSITNSQSLLKPMSIDWWHHPTISSSVISFSFCLQSFPSSGSFLMSQLFTSGGQSIGVSASASVLPMNIHGWLPLLREWQPTPVFLPREFHEQRSPTEAGYSPQGCKESETTEQLSLQNRRPRGRLD